MSNSLLTPSIITKQAMVELRNSMVMLAKVDRTLDASFASKIGDTVSVRKRVLYAATTSADITGSISDSVEGKIDVVLDQRRVVSMQFDSTELGLKIEEFSDRYIRPAMAELVQQVESSISGLYKQVWNFTGTPGTSPTTFLAIGTAGAILTESGCPEEDRCGFYTAAAALTLADGLKGVFPTIIATNAIEKAYVNMYAGFDVYRSMSLSTHTVGAWAGTPLVNGASQNVTYATSKNGYTQSLITDGWSNSITGILKEGDTFTIAGVYAVNPKTRQSTGRLQSFVVRADADSGASTGPSTLTIAPPMITSGAYQTVSAAPADNAAITVTSGTASTAYPQNLLFNKGAFAVAFGQLAKPIGNVMTGSESLDGVSVRMVGDYNVLTDINVWRFDVLYGVKAVAPACAVRHSS